MPTKDQILDSWIMVEHLSEGDIDPHKKIYNYIGEIGQTSPAEVDFYSQFENSLKKKKIGKKGGVVIYFDIFEFSQVIKLLREKFDLDSPYSEINYGNKFALALFFDSNLKFDKEKSFYTASGYILSQNKIPSVKALEEAEKDIADRLDAEFDEIESNKQDYPGEFNKLLTKIFKGYKFTLGKSRYQVVKNLESDATLLHSFFINDLESAKNINTKNLEKYLFGTNVNERVNLDSKKDSEGFNPIAFEEILDPEKYPLGRFPSNSKYALSFMQQTAVNLATGADVQDIRSVNGPPGTGKTTLLKDIFAELIVRQAKDIIDIYGKDSEIKGNEDTIYYKKASIGVLDSKITENNIVVASSNNGAVQNIVNELPLNKEVDEHFLKDLQHVDYFYDLANSTIKKEQSDDKKSDLKFEKNSEDKFWGLFSLEGGKSENMTQICNYLKGIYEYLNDDQYKSDEEAYADFEKQYDKVKGIRDQAKRLAKIGKTINEDSKSLDMSLDYEKLQLSNPWFDEEYRIAQSKLFIAALRVRKQFLFENRKNINAAQNIWNNQAKSLEKNQNLISYAWNWINFTIPVISSTFASFGRMCKNLGPESLGHLFVDEAGQALPQAAVGAIFRSKYVMVVGDPSQIKPVLTLEPSVLTLLGKHYHVDESHLSEDASVQTLVDQASKYGYKKKEGWIGIPLWVHRRCEYPMFTISNDLSYDGLMVQGNKAYGKTGWFDIGGQATDKYVKEQGEFLKRKISQMAKDDPDILDHQKADRIFVISPFKNVAYNLAKDLRSIGFTRYKNYKPTNIGTIHTFQGKEAPIVFMVLGADNRSKGAANWAVSEPNMMNVAATRAKKEFYIIGQRSLYRGNEVADTTYNDMQDYKEQHPDLYDDAVDLDEKSKEKVHHSENARLSILLCK